MLIGACGFFSGVLTRRVCNALVRWILSGKADKFINSLHATVEPAALTPAIEVEAIESVVEVPTIQEPDPWEAPVAEFCTIPAPVATVIQFPLALPPAGKRRRRAASSTKTADKAQTKTQKQSKPKAAKSTGTRKRKTQEVVA